eukprot:gnl/TRDRNA2_/TRDRNA2_182218_c0_seq1.p1 gnl/TRDRNA2_/TRDRNA2_182218_c0~~gnl/TRDRNA2_/TRDRNA2_182218_c0_seq1.p1  ORF type:complete len:412 (+),score=74.48 gnl/TRDRNA2_/TRDRNA2_182218_c0_seq1:90-1238(+)
MPAEDRYVFFCEWFDSNAALIRRYMLTFFPRDNTIEMFDPKNHRPFLKRSEYAEVRQNDLYIGAVVTVLARQLKVVEYADEYTRKKMESQKSRTLLLIKPDAYQQIGNILTAVHATGFVVARLQMVRMSPEQAKAFVNLSVAENPSEPTKGDLLSAEHLSSDVCVAMELVGDRGIENLLALAGPESPAQAQIEAPTSCRAIFGSDDVRNAVHASKDRASAQAEIEFFFGKSMGFKTTALFNNCTLCVIRPHAFAESGGEIVTHILSEGFEISAMQLWYISKDVAEEFLDAYKGVLPEYQDMVTQMSSGPALVLEVRQEDAVESFRALVGPHDPEVAKHLRENTLRARFGVDRVRNAIHCTDLPEDGLLEVEYFFNILYARSR